MIWNDIRHFKKNEWEPHSELIDPYLIYMMDEIRHRYGKYCHIHCAWDYSGHSGTSQHYLGKAVDFHFHNGHIDDMDTNYRAQFEVIQSFDSAGGIGFYGPGIWEHPGFHLDTRRGRLYWTKRKSGYVYSLDRLLEDLGG